MPQTVIITLTIAGTDTGPFDLYSDADGFTAPFEVNVPKASLLVGYVSSLVPNAAVLVKAVSRGLCTSSITMPIIGTSVTTSTTTTVTGPTTSTSTSTTSTTTTGASRLTCVQGVWFLVTQGGVVRYTSCCGSAIVEVGVEEGYQYLPACMIINSLAPAPAPTGAIISEIGYNATTCTCP